MEVVPARCLADLRYYLGITAGGSVHGSSARLVLAKLASDSSVPPTIVIDFCYFVTDRYLGRAIVFSIQRPNSGRSLAMTCTRNPQLRQAIYLDQSPVGDLGQAGLDEI